MDNKISFLAGYILTAASAISAAGFLNAIILGLLGGFFGLLGKEAYYYVRDEYKAKSPGVKAWIAKKIEWLKSKINAQ
jgi:fructose-specific phosphotransferase system IIC component